MDVIMEEDLITFETAKLAKEAGATHFKGTIAGTNMCYETGTDNRLVPAIYSGNYILAPTQSLLAKWIRETSCFLIDVNCYNYSEDDEAFDWSFTITDYRNGDYYRAYTSGSGIGPNYGYFYSYTQAYEAALICCLNMILNSDVNVSNLDEKGSYFYNSFKNLKDE